VGPDVYTPAEFGRDLSRLEIRLLYVPDQESGGRRKDGRRKDGRGSAAAGCLSRLYCVL